MKIHFAAAMLFGIGLTSPVASAQQPPPLRLNVPYTCPGNMIVVVKHCEKRGGAGDRSLLKRAHHGPVGAGISFSKAQARALGLIGTTHAAGGGAPVGQP